MTKYEARLVPFDSVERISRLEPGQKVIHEGRTVTVISLTELKNWEFKLRVSDGGKLIDLVGPGDYGFEVAK